MQLSEPGIFFLNLLNSNDKAYLMQLNYLGKRKHQSILVAWKRFVMPDMRFLRCKLFFFHCFAERLTGKQFLSGIDSNSSDTQVIQAWKNVI